jgi:hypothetical protein
MKVINHHHRKLDRNRNNHSWSNHAKVQSFDHIHKWHRHRQSDRRIRDDNYLFNVENDFHNDEQEISLFETHHEDQDLLERNNEARFRSERNWKSFQRSLYRHLHELSDRDSSHSVFQKAIRSISTADFNSKNWTLRSRNSHSLNFDSRWDLRQRDSRHSCQRNHWMKTIKSRLTDLRHSQFEDTHLSDQKWNSHSRKNWMNWDLKNHHHWTNHSSNYQEIHQECSQKVQKNDTTRKLCHRSNSNKQDRIEKLSS